MIYRQPERLARHQPACLLRRLGDARERQLHGRAANSRARPTTDGGDGLLSGGSSSQLRSMAEMLFESMRPRLAAGMAGVKPSDVGAHTGAKYLKPGAHTQAQLVAWLHQAH